MKFSTTYIASVLLLFLSCFGPSLTSAQTSEEQSAKIDSLKVVLSNATNDTSRVNALIEWDKMLDEVLPDSGMVIKEMMKEIIDKNIARDLLGEEKLFYYNVLGYTLNGFADYRKSRGDLDNSLEIYEQSIEAYQIGGNQLGLSSVFNNLANALSDQGNLSAALDYYNRALAIKEEIGDKEGVGNIIGNIGIVYAQIGEIEKSFTFFRKGLKIKQELNNVSAVASAYNNLGTLHEMAGNMDSCVFYYQKALKIREENGLRHTLSTSYGNIAGVLVDQGRYDDAINQFSLALVLDTELNDEPGKSSTLRRLGAVYAKKGEHGTAIFYTEQALELAKKNNAPPLIIAASERLVESYEALGRYKEALEIQQFCDAIADSMQAISNDKLVLRQEFKHEYDRKAAADSAKSAEAAKVQAALLEAEQAKSRQNELEADQQRLYSYFLYAGLAIVLAFGFVIFNRFRRSQEQNRIIEEQKNKVDRAYDELELKNLEIVDSINYAQRIQAAILPPPKVVKEYLKDSFIFYKPKDIVSGDFYWMQPVDGGVLFAACDCTGHGVPGALVSVVCNNGLNRAVREFGLTEPGEILDKTRELVIQEFEKSEEEVKDGMDIALCHLNGNQLTYAGAHNPLWIIRNGAEAVEEIKANKQPIGKFAELTPYTTHHLELNAGDTIYVFSDGFADQFGGEKGKKYKTANFKRFLMSIQDHSLDNQHALIEQEFTKWSGDCEQLDDICVIGVRIPY